MTADVAAFIDLFYYDKDFNTLFAQNDLIAATLKHSNGRRKDRHERAVPPFSTVAWGFGVWLAAVAWRVSIFEKKKF